MMCLNLCVPSSVIMRGFKKATYLTFPILLGRFVDALFIGA